MATAKLVGSNLTTNGSSESSVSGMSSSLSNSNTNAGANRTNFQNSGLQQIMTGAGNANSNTAKFTVATPVMRRGITDITVNGMPP